MRIPGNRRTFSSPGLPWYDQGIYLSRPCPNTCALWMFDAREALPCDPFPEVSWGDDPNTSLLPIMRIRCDPSLTISHSITIIIKLLNLAGKCVGFNARCNPDYRRFGLCSLRQSGNLSAIWLESRGTARQSH